MTQERDSAIVVIIARLWLHHLQTNRKFLKLLIVSPLPTYTESRIPKPHQLLLLTCYHWVSSRNERWHWLVRQRSYPSRRYRMSYIHETLDSCVSSCCLPRRHSGSSSLSATSTSQGRIGIPSSGSPRLSAAARRSIGNTLFWGRSKNGNHREPKQSKLKTCSLHLPHHIARLEIQHTCTDQNRRLPQVGHKQLHIHQRLAILAHNDVVVVISRLGLPCWRHCW